MIGRRNKMNRGGFSWKRLLGIAAVKSRISRSIGIPLTRSGRQRKLGSILTGGGCLVVIGIVIAIPLVILIIVSKLID
jgi:hypothetical protein